MVQPAAAIAALVAAARLQPELSDELSCYLDQIEAEARHISATCHVLLRNDAEHVPVAAHELVTDVARSSIPTFEGTLTVDAEPGTVAADPIALRRAVLNMISNACRAAGPNGRVVVRVRVAGAVTVEVADSGPGFGAGPAGMASLGLGIVRRIATDHGGDLRIGHSTLGGASVQLTLPRLIVLDHGASQSAVDRGGMSAKYS
jgi:signal transduction histidine kinase